MSAVRRRRKYQDDAVPSDSGAESKSESERLRQSNRTLLDHEVPDEAHLEAGKFAKAIMKLPPMSEKELKEKLFRESKTKNPDVTENVYH